MGWFTSKEQKADIEHHEQAAQGADAQARRMTRAGKPGAGQLWQEYAGDCRNRAGGVRHGRR